MRPITMEVQFRDRQEAGHLLSEKLTRYKNANAVVVAITGGGVCVAAPMAEALTLPLEVMPCREIKHPAGKDERIGAVSEHEVFIHEHSYAIPQHYIYHQVILLRNAIAFEKREYYEDRQRTSFRNKTVILVDDMLRSGETMLVCLRDIKRQNPLEIIVAAPVAEAAAARMVGAEADDTCFLKMVTSIDLPYDHYHYFPRVDRSQARGLLASFRLKHPMPKDIDQKGK